MVLGETRNYPKGSDTLRYNFDEKNYVTGICSMKNDWHEFESLYSGQKLELPFPIEYYINLGIAEMEFPVAPPILDALHDRIDKKRLGYTYSIDPAYRDVVTDWVKRQYDWDVLPKQTSVSEGVLSGLEKLMAMIIPAGKKILVATPVYCPFALVINSAHCQVETTALNNDHGYYTVNWEDFEKKVSDVDVAAFLLCNPHNPVGRAWSEAELRHMGELCFAHDVFVFSDEIHCDMMRMGQKHIPFGKIFPGEKRWAVYFSAGKTFNLSGLTFSNVVISDGTIMSQWENAIGVSSVNALSMEATRAAYTLCDDWLFQMRQYIDDNVRYLKSILEKRLPKACFFIPEGTYFAWIDLSAYHIKENLHTFFLENAAVDVDHGDGFMGGDCHYIRLMLGCTHSTLEIAVDRICNAIAQIK